jgi:flagellar P-ring protein precursor FlgI
MAADGRVYAVAQGALTVAGFAAQGENANIVEGVPTVGRIENGAIVEQEIKFELNTLDNFRISLREPDFTTAKRVTDEINNFYEEKQIANMLDSATIEISRIPNKSIPLQIAELENLKIQPDSPAKVVIDAKSGTIVIGSEVRINKVAISQGGLTVKVEEKTVVNEPEAFTIGDTVITPQTEIEIEEKDTDFVVLEENISLQKLVDGLNKIGVGAEETISILQAIKAAGALHADLEII